MVQYREYCPHPALRHIVECYWNVVGTSDAFQKIYPDACMDILFNFGAPVETRGATGTELTRDGAYVVGNMFVPIETRCLGSADLFGIRFQPSGLGRLLKVRLAEFNDTSEVLTDVYRMGPNPRELADLTPARRVLLLDRWLLRKISLSGHRETWEQCLDRIIQNRGIVNIYGLTREVGISQKQLERKFIEHVGPTPKQFAQLLRFRELKNVLSSGTYNNLLDVATDFQFTDHAHLTRFFQQFARQTPSEYLGAGN